jgi:hypothetical protein
VKKERFIARKIAAVDDIPIRIANVMEVAGFSTSSRPKLRMSHPS